MDEIELAIRSAWARIAPTLARDAAALQPRLDRATKLRTLARPPRAWCLAIRASDSRLAADAPYLTANARVREAPPHTLTIDAATIRKLCAPVTLELPGEFVTDVAAKLGTTPGCLLNARVNGVFRTHYLGGRWSKPRPLLYTDQSLDPATRGFAPPDAVWSWTASHLISRLPRDLPPQELTRVPHYVGRGPDYNIDLDELHPEHPARDDPGALSSSKGNRSFKLPPPPPDYVGYKWKDGEYVGHDWRKPHIAAAYFKKQQSLKLSREAQRRRRRENPAPTKSKGSIQFRGWRWRCPKCGKLVNVLYLPLPPISLIGEELSVASSQLSARSSLATTNWQLATPSFACKSCHRVHYINCTRPGAAWNEFITHLTGGLLFGHEVKRPAWFKLKRKNQYAPKLSRPPSARRIQIQEKMLAGLTINQIASALRTSKGQPLSKGTVLFYAKQIYQQQGVRCLKELLIKHGKPTRPGMRGPGTAPRGSGSMRDRKRNARVRAPSREPRMV
ncbi:MAG: hypothetical protein H7Z14_05470 [Anaerolineae bacterium]|nr:hypothetical protein [Phycisphaerae bacterium]